MLDSPGFVGEGDLSVAYAACGAGRWGGLVLRTFLNLALGTALGLALGCADGSQRGGDPDRRLEGDCLLLPEVPTTGGQFRLALNEPVRDDLAPLPTNDSERIVFRQLYETLVRVDCEGEVRPGLARSWNVSERGRVWTFHLRSQARFWDGTPLRGRDIRAAWAFTATLDAAQGHPLWTWVHPESVRAMGDDVVVVALAEPLGDRPVVFAHPGLAVVKRPPAGGAWVGSGPFRSAIGVGGESMALVPNRYHPTPGNAEIGIVIRPGADPRDLLPKTDVMVLRNRASLEYAHNLPEIGVRPLAWDRIYCLFSPFLPGSPGGGRVTSRELAEGEKALQVLRTELAQNVMHTDSRPAASLSFAEDEMPRCTEPSPPPGADLRVRQFTPAHYSGEEPPRLVVQTGDAESARLAERLVALAAQGRGDPATGLPVLPEGVLSPVVVSSPGEEFLSEFRKGWAWGYVAPVNRNFAHPCLEARDLYGTLTWLWCHAGGCDASHFRFQRAAIPLVASRLHLAVRRGLTGLAEDGDGTLLLSGAGWTEGREAQ